MICVSLGSISFEECTKALSKTEFAELRIDLLDFSNDQFKTLFALKHKSIATCRKGNYDDSGRMNKLKDAITFGAGYIDVEYESDGSFRNELVEFAGKNGVKVIISYHNYENTPAKVELETIIENSLKWGANIVKIATLANSDEDCARVLGLYENCTKLLAFCMGEKGIITRIAAPVLGAPFTFASLDKTLATAPGQLTIEEFTSIFRALGIK